MVLGFTDGVTIDTEGPWRILHLKDGYYVVGMGMCCPVDSRAEGEALIDRMKSSQSKPA